MDALDLLTEEQEIIFKQPSGVSERSWSLVPNLETMILSLKVGNS